MGAFWNRKKSPRSIEELMIHEFLDTKLKVFELDLERQRLDNIIEAETSASALTIENLKNDIDTLNTRIKQIESDTDGILDLHGTIQLYYVEIASRYTIKSYFPEGTKGRLAELKAWSLFSKNRLIREAQDCKLDYHGKMLSIKEVTANIISIPVGHTRVKCAINYPGTQKIIDIDGAEFTTGAWLPLPFNEVIDKVYKELNANINQAIIDLTKEVAENDE